MDDVTAKVLAETWRVRNAPNCRDEIYCDTYRGDAPTPPPEHVGYIFGNEYGPGSIHEASNEVRARIAACAPEALRLLLANEWCSFTEVDGHPVSSCHECTANMLEPDHDPDCTWLALMKKAGLR